MLAGADTLVVVLEDTLNRGERTLLALGEIDRLRQSRLTVQQALEYQARSAVEAALGRRTLAYITGIDPRRGVAVGLFTLEAAAVADGERDGAFARAGEAR